MQQEHEIDHAIVEEYTSSNVIQDDEADQRNRTKNGELGQSDSVENSLEVHVRFSEDTPAQDKDCVEDQVEVHVFGVLTRLQSQLKKS